MLAIPSASSREIVFSIFGMMVLLLAALSVSLLGSEWLTRDGLVKAGGPYQSRRRLPAGASHNMWLRGIAGHELLLLARDRNLMVQVLIVPLLLPAYYLFTNTGMATAVGGNFRSCGNDGLCGRRIFFSQ
jgi:hypothetical protein